MTLLIVKTIFFLALLLVGSEQVVTSSLRWAKYLGLSSFLVGFLLVALGTSIPEMVTAFISASQSHWALVSGNLIGSNLFNSLIVLGSCALFSPLSFSKKEIKIDLPVLLFCTFSLAVALWDFHFQKEEALVFIGLYFAYILFLFFSRKEKKKKKVASEKFSLKMLLQMIFGFVCLHLGGQGFIESCLRWVQLLPWDSVQVGVIIVALGTSLPELMVSLGALWKKQKTLALGNVLGSNLLNLWLILGLSRFFLPQKALVPLSAL